MDWASLSHAYGPATEVPAKLAELARRDTSNTGPDDALWEWMLSALVHQGDVYSATFAATPKIVEICRNKPAAVQVGLIWFIGWVEHCRQVTGFTIPESLLDAHEQAVRDGLQIALSLIPACSSPSALEDVFSAISAFHGHTSLTDQLSHLDFIPDEVLIAP